MRKWFFVLLFVSLFALVACGKTNDTNDADEHVGDKTGEEQVDHVSGIHYPFIFTDVEGNEVTIEKEPERIVSLIPSITETLFALGQGDKLVGRTDFCNYPAEVSHIESVGGLQFNVETIVAMQPDLVIAHASSKHSSEGGLKQLEESGIPVAIIIDAKKIDDVYRGIDMIATLTNAEEKGEQLIANMKDSFADIAEKAKQLSEAERANVWVEVSPAPDLFTTGTNTFLHELLEMIGANNVAKDVEGWVAFTEEEAVALNPDVIVMTYGAYVEHAIESLLDRSGWQDVPAVKNKRIYDIDADSITRSGPRLVEGAKQLATSIYPEIFN